MLITQRSRVFQFSSRGFLLLALGAWAIGAAAQESTGGAASSGSSSSSGTDTAGSNGGSSGASSAFGSLPAAPAPSASYGATAPNPANPADYIPPSGAGNNPTGFGTGIGTGTPAQSGQPAGTEIPGGIGGTRAEESPTSFSISTGYGRAPEVFVSGEGRLARPKFQTRVSGSIGFDDNIFQTPTNARGTDPITIRQQLTAGSPEQVVFLPVANTGPRRLGAIGPTPTQQVQRVVIPAVDPTFEDIVIPGTPKPKRQVSAISRESFSFEAQVATRRSLFTADFNINADYYWSRPKDKAEYNGSLALRYLHRITPRLQVTAALDANYLSQPDLTQINTPTTVGNGNYLVINSKVDISYRWTPRFSTVSSVNYSQLSFDEPARQGGDYRTLTLGTEFRYLWSPKITAVIEGRYGTSSYPNAPGLDSSSVYGLLGLDLSLSRRAGGTLRFGLTDRMLDQGGKNSLAPYLETALNYQLSKASVLSWNSRVGFEDPQSATSEVLGFRSGLSVTHFFGPRLRGSLGVNGIFRRTTDDTLGTSLNETTLDSNLSLLYTLTRDWTFNMNYSYVALFTEPSSNDYFRNRVFAGFDYSF